MRAFRPFADCNDPHSLSSRFRAARLRRFTELLATIPPPVRIADFGGTPTFWDHLPLPSGQQISVEVFNLLEFPSTERVRCSVADVRSLSGRADQSFDLSFSNSVIEHVGPLADQSRMASEMRRLAPRLYLQTPNRRFPLEPHFLFPFFPYLPRAVQRKLLTSFDVGWFTRAGDRASADALIDSVHLHNRA
jgi:hypothetical protein